MAVSGVDPNLVKASLKNDTLSLGLLSFPKLKKDSRKAGKVLIQSMSNV